MKVLSLTEPYATLIKEKKKQIETRSFRTNYRGELYIHASSTAIKKETKNNKKLMQLVDNPSFPHGYIICKCNLVNCIEMTKEYVEDMKKNHPQEYLCGDYQEGRFAWILEDIVPLETPLKAKGQLGIWNYYRELEIMDLMKDIAYGWIDKNNNKHHIVDNHFSDDYRLQSPQEVSKNQIGVCWDQIELERYYMKAYENVKTYFLVYYNHQNCPTHTFLTYQKQQKYYWFEHAWNLFQGIHEYQSQEDLLLDFRNKFIEKELNNHFQKSNLILYEYQKPASHLSTEEFYKHCEQGKKIFL